MSKRVEALRAELTKMAAKDDSISFEYKGNPPKTDRERAERWSNSGATLAGLLEGMSPGSSLKSTVGAGLTGYGAGRLAHRLWHGRATGAKIEDKKKTKKASIEDTALHGFRAARSQQSKRFAKTVGGVGAGLTVAGLGARYAMKKRGKTKKASIKLAVSASFVAKHLGGMNDKVSKLPLSLKQPLASRLQGSANKAGQLVSKRLSRADALERSIRPTTASAVANRQRAAGINATASEYKFRRGELARNVAGQK